MPGCAPRADSSLTCASSPGQGFSTWTWPAGSVVSAGDSGGALGPGCPRGTDPLPLAELLSAEHSSACSPRLSPDGQLLLYLEGGLGGPHRQCLRLRMVSGAPQALGTAVPPCAAGTGLSMGCHSRSLCPAGVGGWACPSISLPQFPWRGPDPDLWVSPAHLADKAVGDGARRGAGAHRG